jgi:hypothetical protein
MRASQGQWTAAAGLIALAGGLLCLRAAQTRPAFKTYAWICFAGTAISMVIVFMRQYR